MQLKHLFIVLTLFSNAVFAQNMTAADAFAAGKTAGGKTSNQAILNGVNSTKGAEVINNYSTTAPSQASNWGGNQTGLNTLYTGGNAKISECGAGGSSSNKADQQHCEAVNSILNGQATNPGNLITKSDPLYQKGRAIAADPESIAGAIDGNYSNCTTSTKPEEPDFTYETCEDWYTTETATCSMGLEIVLEKDFLYGCRESLKVMEASSCTYGTVVKVDKDYNYQCVTNENAVETVKCNRILNVSCTPMSDGCDNGSIQVGSIGGDMFSQFKPDGSGNWILQFGTIGDNYWSGNTYYDRQLNFNIVDKSKVSLFSLVRAKWDDWLWVKINGTSVYIGPHGGDQLTPKSVRTCTRGGSDSGRERCSTSNRVYYTATKYGNYELKTSWDRSMNIDLRPYLRNGSNSIWTRTVVGGKGESSVSIRTRMYCPQNCTDSWTNQCQSLEARAK